MTDETLDSADDLRPGDVIEAAGQQLEIEAIGNGRVHTSSGDTLHERRLVEWISDGSVELLSRGPVQSTIDAEIIDDLGTHLDSFEEIVAQMDSLPSGLHRAEVRDLLWVRTDLNKGEVDDALDTIETTSRDPEKIVRDLLFARTDLNKTEADELLGEIDTLRAQYGGDDS